MREITVKATTDNLPEVLAFADGMLEESECPMKVQIQIDVAIEELFVNIANYAYTDGVGEAVIGVEITEDPAGAVIMFRDSGVPFDPTTREDPDVTLAAEDRQIGGLGIYMVKKSMDEISYEYKDGCNILTIKKLY